MIRDACRAFQDVFLADVPQYCYGVEYEGSSCLTRIAQGVGGKPELEERMVRFDGYHGRHTSTEREKQCRASVDYCDIPLMIKFSFEGQKTDQ